MISLYDLDLLGTAQTSPENNAHKCLGESKATIRLFVVSREIENETVMAVARPISFLLFLRLPDICY